MRKRVSVLPIFVFCDAFDVGPCRLLQNNGREVSIEKVHGNKNSGKSEPVCLKSFCRFRLESKKSKMGCRKQKANNAVHATEQRRKRRRLPVVDHEQVRNHNRRFHYLEIVVIVKGRNCISMMRAFR